MRVRCESADACTAFFECHTDAGARHFGEILPPIRAWDGDATVRDAASGELTNVTYVGQAGDD